LTPLGSLQRSSDPLSVFNGHALKERKGKGVGGGKGREREGEGKGGERRGELSPEWGVWIRHCACVDVL